MPNYRVIARSCLEFGVLIPTAALLLHWLLHVIPSAERTLRLMAFIFVVWRMYAVTLFGIRVRLSREGALHELVETHLFSDNWWLQYRAVTQLAIVAARPAATLLLRRRQRRALEYWRTWWKTHGDDLTWDPVLRTYLPAVSAPHGVPGTPEITPEEG